MQLTHAAGVEAHVHAGHALGDAELARRYLPGPAAAGQPHMGIVEREPQVRQGTVIGGRRDQ
jgi:hypothetical protein